MIDVVSAGPADEAGVSRWDVIVRIDDAEIETAADATAAILDAVPGDTVELELARGGQMVTVEATIGERPSGT